MFEKRSNRRDLPSNADPLEPLIVEPGKPFAKQLQIERLRRDRLRLAGWLKVGGKLFEIGPVAPKRMLRRPAAFEFSKKLFDARAQSGHSRVPQKRSGHAGRPHHGAPSCRAGASASPPHRAPAADRK